MPGVVGNDVGGGLLGEGELVEDHDGRVLGAFHLIQHHQWTVMRFKIEACN